MHRDKKIGFALGILLVGIVAAFFFRNEPDPFAELPPLDDPASLDAQIAEKPNAPYTDDLSQPPAPANGSQSNPFAIPDIYRPEYRQPLPGENPPATPAAPAPINLAEPTPAPFDNSNSVIEVRSPFLESPPIGQSTSVGEPLPGNEAWTTIKPATTGPNSQPPLGTVSDSRPIPAKTPASPAAMYQIRQGDTLSVLAEKHLGSSRRYMEIYQANRDKLKDPNDIQVGMLIRIPPRVKFNESRTQPPLQKTKPSETPSSSQPPRDDANLFTPFSRSPLAPERN